MCGAEILSMVLQQEDKQAFSTLTGQVVVGVSEAPWWPQVPQHQQLNSAFNEVLNNVNVFFLSQI